MDSTTITHILGQKAFNDAVHKVLTNQINFNKACGVLFAACGVYLYFNNKKISKLTSEVKELKQMKGA